MLFRVESGEVEQNRVLTLPLVHPASCGSKGEACQWGMLQEQSWVALSMVWCQCVHESKPPTVSMHHAPHNEIDNALLVGSTMMQALLPSNC